MVALASYAATQVVAFLVCSGRASAVLIRALALLALLPHGCQYKIASTKLPEKLVQGLAAALFMDADVLHSHQLVLLPGPRQPSHRASMFAAHSQHQQHSARSR